MPQPDGPKWYEAEPEDLLRAKMRRAHEARQQRVTSLVTRITAHREDDPDCEGGPGCPGYYVINLIRSLDPDQMADLALAALIAAADRTEALHELTGRHGALIDRAVEEGTVIGLAQLETVLKEADRDHP